MPFMNKALARLVQEEHPQYANDAGDQVRLIDVTSRDALMSPFQWVQCAHQLVNGITSKGSAHPLLGLP